MCFTIVCTDVLPCIIFNTIFPHDTVIAEQFYFLQMIGRLIDTGGFKNGISKISACC